MKQKICEIIGNATRGGVESYIFSYCRSMKDDFEFTFVCFDDSKYPPRKEVEELGGKLVFVPNIKKITKCKKSLKNLFLANKYDIVHSHLNVLSVFPLKIAKDAGIKVRICQSHALSNRKEFLRHIAKLLLRRKAQKCATHLLAVSEEAGIFHYGKKSVNKFTVIQPSVETERFAFNKLKRTELRHELCITDNDYVVGSVGRLCKTKNQLFLLNAFKEISKTKQNYFLVLIGSGPLKDKIQRKIDNEKINRVILIDAKDNVYDYYNVFDVLAFPSLYEGYGLVPVEAQCNGLYCYCSNQIGSKHLDNKLAEFIPLIKNDWVKALLSKKERDINESITYRNKLKKDDINKLKVFYQSCLR